MSPLTVVMNDDVYEVAVKCGDAFIEFELADPFTLNDGMLTQFIHHLAGGSVTAVRRLDNNSTIGYMCTGRGNYPDALEGQEWFKGRYLMYTGYSLVGRRVRSLQEHSALMKEAA